MSTPASESVARSDIYFAEKDKALRDDVHRLGELVGELVKEGITAGTFRAGDVSALAQSVIDAYAVFTPPYPASGGKCPGSVDGRLEAMHEASG